MAKMTRICLIALILFVITILPKHRKLVLNYNKSYSHTNTIPSTPFVGGDQNHRFICQNKQICLPTALQKKTVDWYHDMLCHPGETQAEHTLRQHFDWKGLRTTVHNVCKKCPTCQRAKTTTQKYVNCHLNRLKKIPGTRYV